MIYKIYACKDFVDKEIASYKTKKEAELFVKCIEGCENLAGYVLIIKEEL